MECEGKSIRERVAYGRSWKTGDTIRWREPVNSEQREQRTEIRRLHRQQKTARADVRELGSMQKQLDQAVVQRVDFEEWLAAVDQACAKKGIKIFPDGSPEHDALNAARHELASLHQERATGWKFSSAPRAQPDGELPRLKAELSAKFEAYRDLQDREAKLKTMVAARMNIVSRWFFERNTAKLEKTKAKMNANRERVEKSHSTRQRAKLGKEMAALRRQFGRLQTKIRARMTPDERYFAGQIREQKHRLLGEINRDRSRNARTQASAAA